MSIEIYRYCDLCHNIVTHHVFLGPTPYVPPTPEWLVCGECEAILGQISEQDLAVQSKYQLQVVKNDE